MKVYVVTYVFCEDATVIGVAETIPAADRIATEHLRRFGSHEARRRYGSRSLPWRAMGAHEDLTVTVHNYESYDIERHEVQS